MIIKRGNIYLANLDPTLGSEIYKIRPVVVVSNDINNQHNKLITIIPITSKIERVRHFEVFLSEGMADLSKKSKVKTDQIRSIDWLRLIKEIGSLPSTIVEQIEDALKLHLLL